MEFELIELVNGEESFGSLLSCKLPAQKAFQLSKSVKKVREELLIFNERRNALIKEYAVEGKNADEVPDQFKKEIEELFKVKVEIDVPKIKISEIRGGSYLSAMDCIKLVKIIEE